MAKAKVTQDSSVAVTQKPAVVGHWCADSPVEYKLDALGDFWVRKSDGMKFCNMTETEHDDYQQYEGDSNNIATWCSRCDDMTV